MFGISRSIKILSFFVLMFSMIWVMVNSKLLFCFGKKLLKILINMKILTFLVLSFFFNFFPEKSPNMHIVLSDLKT